MYAGPLWAARSSARRQGRTDRRRRRPASPLATPMKRCATSCCRTCATPAPWTWRCSACTARWWPTATTIARATCCARAREIVGGHGDRRGTGSALPSDRDHDGIRRPHRLLQGIPHTDILDRAYELVDLCVAKAEGRIRPTRGVFDCQLISVMHTSREPMRGFVDKLMAMEGKNGVLSISIAHGFPGATPPTWAPRCWSIPMAIGAGRGAGARAGPGDHRFSRTAVAGLSAHRRGAGPGPGARRLPVVLADSADNAGGGAPSDATFILERVLARGIEDVAMGPFWDPVSVQLCFEAGEGAEVQLRVGGRSRPCRASRWTCAARCWRSSARPS